MPAQLANESFRADYVRFGNSVGAVVQVLMRSDIPAAEAFFRDHLRLSPTGAARVGSKILANQICVNSRGESARGLISDLCARRSRTTLWRSCIAAAIHSRAMLRSWSRIS